MADTTAPTVATHGATRLPLVHVDSYNIELKDDEGFLGDRANKRAFRDIIENWRKPLRKAGKDPLGDVPLMKSAKKNSMRCSRREIRRQPASCRERSRTLRKSLRWSFVASLSSSSGRKQSASSSVVVSGEAGWASLPSGVVALNLK